MVRFLLNEVGYGKEKYIKIGENMIILYLFCKIEKKERFKQFWQQKKNVSMLLNLISDSSNKILLQEKYIICLITLKLSIFDTYYKKNITYLLSKALKSDQHRQYIQTY
jgi:hypothetical protein